MSELRGYEIKDAIGSGAYGSVYRAWQAAVGREVAIKVIRPEQASEPEFVERFEAEAQMVARLEHPHIVPVYDYWRDESGAYLVMRLLGGGSLKDALADGPLSQEAFLQLADDICRALSAAHARSVVHRDLKPSNILYDGDGNAYLADFGIAKNLEAELKLTQTGAVLGTPNYISPEQIRGETVTPATDQYSLGIVLFEALTGRLPYPDESVATLFHKHLTAPLPLLASVDVNLPAELDPVLQQATAKEPSDRYPEMMELAEALRSAFGDQLSATSHQPSAAGELPAFLEEGGQAERERPVFVGRETEMARLASELEVVNQGQGKLLFVQGEAGSGKSALLSAFAGRASEGEPELLVAWGICNAFSGHGDPYHPFRQIVNTLTGELESKVSSGTLSAEQGRRIWSNLPAASAALVESGPGLVDTLVSGAELVKRLSSALPAGSTELSWVKQVAAAGGEATAEQGQAQLFEHTSRLLRALAADKTLLLVLDDLQWADSGSISLLFHLSRELAGVRILVLASYRPEEVALGRDGDRHPLGPVLDEIRRIYGDVWIDLDRPPGADFVDSLLDEEPNHLDEHFRQTLYEHTQAHPLFTVELIRDLKERGDLVQDSGSYWLEGPSLDWTAVPDRVEGVIEARIGRLSEELREILTVASVEGTDFTAQIVARVQEVQERKLLRQLSRELERRHRLVREGEAVSVGGRHLSRYRFAHGLFQQFLYNDLSAGERRLLHGEIAAILEELYAGRLDEIAVQLAHHFIEAGEGDRALPYLQQAGDDARNMYAFQSAIENYEQALKFLEENGEFDRAARVLMKLGLTYHNAFRFDEARRSYENGFVLWRQAGSAETFESLPAPQPLRLRSVEPSTLDPVLTSDVRSQILVEQLFSGLVEIDPELDIVPDIAQSWKVLDGGRRYVFNLRDDVTWSDGVQVTAADFQYALIRALDPATDSVSSEWLYEIKGARNYHRGASGGPETVGVRVADRFSLEIELEKPSSHFLQVAAHYHPLPRHTVQKYGREWTDSANFVTNGPFRLVDLEPGQWMTLKRNPTYHGKFTGNVESVKLHFADAAEEEVGLYLNDHIDYFDMSASSLAEFKRLRQIHLGEYLTEPLLRTFYIGFDQRRPPFDDPRVRQAFAVSLDKKKLASVVLGGRVFPASGGLVPPGMPGHTPGIGLAHDPEKGRRLLAKSGYPGGRGFPEVEFLTGGIEMSDMPPYIRKQWLENLDIEVNQQVLGWNSFLDRLHANPPHVWIMGWDADIPDPANFLVMGGWQSRAGWQNAEFDGLIDEALDSTDQRRRLRLFEQAERILIREAAIVPVYYARNHYLLKPWVRRFPSSALKNWYWKDVIIDPH